MQRTVLVGMYFTMKHPKYGKSNFRFTPSQLNGEDFSGWEIESMRSPSFKFADIISDESARKLWEAVH